MFPLLLNPPATFRSGNRPVPSLKGVTHITTVDCPIRVYRQIETSKADMDTELSEEVKKLEEFVEGRLKPNLVRAIAERDKVFERQKVFSDLRKNIENLEKNTVTSMKTLVNIGAEIYTEAEAPDTQHIFVEVGHGFYVEFTWSEALNYIAEREKLLSRQIEEYTRKIGATKVQIKVALEAIRKLLKLPDAEL